MFKMHMAGKLKEESYLYNNDGILTVTFRDYQVESTTDKMSVATVNNHEYIFFNFEGRIITCMLSSVGLPMGIIPCFVRESITIAPIDLMGKTHKAISLEEHLTDKDDSYKYYLQVCINDSIEKAKMRNASSDLYEVDGIEEEIDSLYDPIRNYVSDLLGR